MKFEQSFEVQAPAERVWALMTDLTTMTLCLPGAELTDSADEGGYEGTFKVELGSTDASYRGRIHLEDRDDEGRRVVIRASGQEQRGQGSATATMITTVARNGHHSNVTVATDVLITGKLARFGRGGELEGVSIRLLADFAQSLQAQLVGPDGAATAAAPAAAEPAAEPPLAAEEAAVAPAPPADLGALPGPGSGPEPGAANTTGGVIVLLGSLSEALRRNAPAAGGAAAGFLVLVRWRRRRSRRRGGDSAVS
jgi:carbon monoxide dehydrogenase subunit G